MVRGFRSKLDGSVQPYGLVIPETYSLEGAQKRRLDFWFHGRGERTLELAFIQQRLTNPGQDTPPDTIMLHPYARFSNGNKFAGEIDCLEALEHAQEYYRIDPERILVRGFSMGGAACWNFAVHYLNNARQVSTLPDWAVVDITSPPTTQLPGAIPAAGFFGESWQLQEHEE